VEFHDAFPVLDFLDCRGAGRLGHPRGSGGTTAWTPKASNPLSSRDAQQ